MEFGDHELVTRRRLSVKRGPVRLALNQMVTQEQIARHAGLSRSTVKAVLNSDPRIRLSEKTRETVLKSVRQLGYHANRHAQAVRLGRSNVIGIIQPGTFIYTIHTRAMHAAMAIHAAHYNLLDVHLIWTPRGIHDATTAILESRVEGVLLVGASDMVPPDLVQQIRKAGIPIVSVTGMRLKGIPHVRAGVRKGMFDLATHLLNMGHRKLTLLTSWEDAPNDPARGWHSLERVAGLRDAVAAFGETAEFEADYDDAFNRAETAYDTGFRRMRRVLERPVRPDAVLCTNDRWAVGALAACHASGVRVPEDIAVTGFDNEPISAYTAPPLTSVEQPNEAMARQGVVMLTRLICGEKLSTEEQLVEIPCRLVVRKSCRAGNGMPSGAADCR